MTLLRKSVSLLALALATLTTLASTGRGGTFADNGPSDDRLKVGLVLGGGGAKGAAEVGVLKVIEELDIPIDYIAGTSIGSIVGGLYSLGYTAAELDSVFRAQNWLPLLADRSDEHASKPLHEAEGVVYVFGYPVSRRGSKQADPSFGALKGDNVVQLLRAMIGQRTAKIPFRAVAFDIKEQREVVLNGDSLALAMRASMAIPGVFKPVKTDDMVLVDGGMMNNLPVDVVLDMGADIVIAIDLTQSKERNHTFSLKESLGIGGLLDWAVSRPDITRYNENVEKADLIINPPLYDYDVSSFSEASISQMITIGEQCARRHTEDLQRLRQRILNP